MQEDSLLRRAGTAVFEPGVSFHFFFCHFTRQEGWSEMIPAWRLCWLQCLTPPILIAFLHTNFGVCVCVCFRQCDKAIFPLCLLLLRNVVLIDSLWNQLDSGLLKNEEKAGDWQLFCWSYSVLGLLFLCFLVSWGIIIICVYYLI